MPCAALPGQVHPLPPTTNLITRCHSEAEVAYNQATTRRPFLPLKMRESHAIPALLSGLNFRFRDLAAVAG